MVHLFPVYALSLCMHSLSYCQHFDQRDLLQLMNLQWHILNYSNSTVTSSFTLGIAYFMGLSMYNHISHYSITFTALNISYTLPSQFSFLHPWATTGSFIVPVVFPLQNVILLDICSLFNLESLLSYMHLKSL